ncbi:hypothetical protein BDV33DRAFT_185716 [Aspergillus novoparasiticus]|uniref:Zn(2)-C6 fungal-type domain-containing protein n=1 Tax=Aspergillus novoparasiticus TaxID=986946 RepID=A0A5N6E782_9EURO|nr:hypothetical protein BDV33DRAFT_185716 [Aspergillus novoparasiticus]
MSGVPKWTRVGSSAHFRFKTSPARSQRKNSPRACSACQRRKSKCTGAVPCRNCRKHRTACSIDTETDQRRKTQLKRRLMQLEETSGLLDGLLEILRDENRVGRSSLHGSLGSNRFLNTICKDIWRKPSLQKTVHESVDHARLRYLDDFLIDDHQPPVAFQKIFSPEDGHEATTVGESQNDSHKSLNEGFIRKSPCMMLPVDMPNNRIQSSMCSPGVGSLRPRLHGPQTQCHPGDTGSPAGAQYICGLNGTALFPPHCLEPPFSFQERDFGSEMLRKLRVKV